MRVFTKPLSHITVAQATDNLLLMLFSPFVHSNAFAFIPALGFFPKRHTHTHTKLYISYILYKSVPLRVREKGIRLERRMCRGFYSLRAKRKGKNKYRKFTKETNRNWIIMNIRRKNIFIR